MFSGQRPFVFLLSHDKYHTPVPSLDTNGHSNGGNSEPSADVKIFRSGAAFPELRRKTWGRGLVYWFWWWRGPRGEGVVVHRSLARLVCARRKK